ncbi:MAG TPA: AraC family transcriptional regulator [Clostridiaceae bacterium]|nr:AraC family transcriptional regulator [Clostridiaceae bacterium]
MNFDITKASDRLSELDLKIISGSFDINVLWYRVMQCNNDHIIERHTHSTIEFHFVYSGSCRVVLDNESFFAREGEFYITAPGIYHRQEINKGYVEFSLNCELNTADDQDYEGMYVIDTLKNVRCRPYKDVTGATQIFMKVLEEAFNQNIGFYNNICSLTVMLIMAAVRAINGPSPAKCPAPVKQKKNAYRFSQIQDYIRNNISLPISTTDISRYMFLGEKQVSRIIKEATGKTTKELIQEYKFQEAKTMLIERQDLTIKQIAEKLGFSSQYYFNQFFKRKEGYPPGIFRKNTRSG